MFRKTKGNFYYTMMPFRLKNAGDTNQYAMTCILFFKIKRGTSTVDFVLIMENYNVVYVQEAAMCTEILIQEVENINRRSYIVKTATD